MIYEAIHPGKIVKECCVTATGLTVTEAAENLGVDRTTFSRLINGHAGISPEMAMRLSLALNSEAKLWLNLQRDYDLWLLNKKHVEFHVKPIHLAHAS